MPITMVQPIYNIKGTICKKVDAWFSFPTLTDPIYNPKVYLMSWEWDTFLRDLALN